MAPNPLVIGHRGWPARHPENTLAGFIAVADVADVVELDVRRCGDGRLVVSHDPVLGGHAISETSWSVLAEIDVGGGHHPALLDEVMAALVDTPIQLEVKNWFTDPGFEPDGRIGLETAERSRPGDTVTCFNPETLAVVRDVFPEVRTGLAVEAPLDLATAVAICREGGHVAVIPNHVLIEGELDTAIEVYPWTVNDPARALELVELGVTGIITDEAGRIVDLLGRGQ